MRWNKILLIVAILAMILSGCLNKSPQNSGIGILRGKISIGPMCPVERMPPDPNCQPTAETYKAGSIWVSNPDKSLKIAQIEPDINGSYSLELPAGSYVVDLESQNHGIGGRNLPVLVNITANQTTNLDINIDTGIR